MEAQKVQVLIPTPSNASNVTVYTEKGKAKYNGGDNNVVWKCVAGELCYQFCCYFLYSFSIRVVL